MQCFVVDEGGRQHAKKNTEHTMISRELIHFSDFFGKSKLFF